MDYYLLLAGLIIIHVRSWDIGALIVLILFYSTKLPKYMSISLVFGLCSDELLQWCAQFMFMIESILDYELLQVRGV